MSPMSRAGAETWDLVVVGAGPAGAATALGALTADPSLRVLLLDRAAFRFSSPEVREAGRGLLQPNPVRQ